jgi:hypothetical protein
VHGAGSGSGGCHDTGSGSGSGGGSGLMPERPYEFNISVLTLINAPMSALAAHALWVVVFFFCLVLGAPSS